MSTLTFSIRVEENQEKISLWIVKREQEEQFKSPSILETSKEEEDYIGQHRSSTMIAHSQTFSKDPLQSETVTPWVLDWAIEAIREFLKDKHKYSKPIELNGLVTLPAAKAIILFVKSSKLIYE